MSGPYQRRDLFNNGAGMLHIANHCGVFSVNEFADNSKN